MLSALIRGKLVIITGRDMCVYDEAGISDELSHKLLAEINAARTYAENMSIRATGARRRRDRLETLATNENAPKPRLNGFPPAWLTWSSEHSYQPNDQLRRHLNDFINAYNFGRRLKTLNDLTPYEAMCKTWTVKPKRFMFNPLH